MSNNEVTTPQPLLTEEQQKALQKQNQSDQRKMDFELGRSAQHLRLPGGLANTKG